MAGEEATCVRPGFAFGVRTHTPAGPAAIVCGWPVSPILARTRCVAGSTRTTVSAKSVTQSDPSPNAASVGEPPTRSTATT